MKKSLAFLVTGLLGAMLLAASSASATTLFAGGEDSDFTLGGGAALSQPPALSPVVMHAKSIAISWIHWRTAKQLCAIADFHGKFDDLGACENLRLATQ